MQKSGYYTSVNPELLASIPLTAKSVLEIGCGAGALGHVYKTLNPSAIYVGVEYVKEAAELSSRVLNHVVCGDVEDTDLIIPSVRHGLYDCIVYGDVLEHLKNPWNCLTRHIDLLSHDGVVVACIPNVQHWSVLANLLNGQWPTVDQGLFDRTHLRWFTRDSIVQWFQSAGLHIYDMQSRIFAQDKAKDFVQKMLPALQNLGLDPKKVLDGMSPLQYVVTAGRIPRKSLLIEGFSNIKPDSMVEVRLSQPLRALASQPGVNFKLHRENMKLVASSQSPQKVLVWQRPIFHPTKNDFQTILTLLRYGYVVVIDFDDDPDHWPAVKDNEFITFKMVHAVQTSRPELAEKISQWNPNVKVFSNMLERLPDLDIKKKNYDISGLRMFFGAFNREKDWAPLIDHLNSVFRQDPDFWSLSVIHDRAFFDAIDLPCHRKTFLPLCSHSKYLNKMTDCDFAFLPLLETSFNRLKSDVKFVEASSCGLASLASNVVYESSIHSGITGELFHSPSEMVACLKAWKEDPQRVVSMGQAAYQWVRKNRMAAYQVEEREDWYRQLVLEKKSLTRQLLERVPQLREKMTP